MDATFSSPDRDFRAAFATDLAELLAPIPAAAAGDSLRGGAVYRRIQAARRQDDPSLPQGVWVQELQRADWAAVSRECVHALTTQSKDLQLAAWLLEASVAQHGLVALAPGFALLRGLGEAFGEQLHPTDPEWRGSVVRWLGQTLGRAVRLLPLTDEGLGGGVSWAEWELAQRDERRRAVLGPGAALDQAGPTAEECGAALRQTPTAKLAQRRAQLTAALAELERWHHALVALGVDEADAAALHPLANLLATMADLLAAELASRS